MSNGKATVSFFENGSTTQFEYCFKLYPEVLKLKAEKRSKKPQELIRLDEWYQNELPRLIKARGKDAHMVYDELVQSMKWKQSRGKFYPQLSYLVKVNTPRAVIAETKKAFRKLPNLEQAITALSNLKGVGTTMASALLAACAPDKAPFMADECLMAIPEIEGIDYTTKEYLNFVQHIQSTVERLNAEVGGETPHWSPHRVELALWAHYVANDLNPELLDDMPTPGSANTNGSLNKSKDKVLADGEDTNDGVALELDDESAQGAGGNTATESETENENTNPGAGQIKTNINSNSTAVGALQDGDSNFVSNDSTSQEPINEDNTTQTTATTTSTEPDGEDGEGPRGGGRPAGGNGNDGTPLASDSESNLEAPVKANHEAAAGDNNNKQINNNGQAATVATVAASAAVAAVAAAAAAGNVAVAAAKPASNGNGNGVDSAHRNAGVEEEDDDEDDEDDELDADDDDDEEEDELEADESNSNSSNLRDSSNKLHATKAAAAAATVLGTQSGTAAAIGQKRTALHCELDVKAAPGAGGGEAGKSPELKKLRSE